VRVVQGGEQLRFALETGNPIGVIRKDSGKHLDRDVAIEAGVARAIHLAHPARAKRRGNFVRSQAHACL
jgi:hypothetical protein